MCALIALSLSARAQDLAQQIKLGPHTFYVPKAWMHDLLVTASAPYSSSGPAHFWTKPQAGPIEAEELGITIPESGWAPWPGALPKFIRLRHAAAVRLPLPDAQTKQLLDLANFRQADIHGFVRVATGFTEPGQQPQWEDFIRKGYLNEVGDPLLIHSNNMELSFGFRLDSRVQISVKTDLGVQYGFSNTKFPEARWWGLYRRVRSFINYLQEPR